MEESICGVDCCSECGRKEECGGCRKTDGHPFGGTCIAAESIRQGGMDAFWHLKNTLISEFNALGIPGLQVDNLNLLNGFFVNLEYPLANGQSVKLLEDNNVYWGTRSKFPEATDAMGWLRTNSTFWSATISAAARSQGSSAIEKGASDE